MPMVLLTKTKGSKDSPKNKKVIYPGDRPLYGKDNSGAVYIFQCNKDNTSRILRVENPPANLTDSVMKVATLVNLLRPGDGPCKVDMVSRTGSVVSIMALHV